MKWYRLAATEGAPRALYQLAALYARNDHGIDPDPVKALAYLWAAQREGVEVGSDEVEAFRRGLSPLELQTAEQLAATL